MLKLAIAGNPAFSVCTYETDRGGVNYTVDTLTHIHEEEPGGSCFSDGRRHAPGSSALETARAGLPVALPGRSALRGHGGIGHQLLICCDQSTKDRRNPPAPGRDARDRHKQQRYPPPRSRRKEHSLLHTQAVEKYIETQGLYKTEPR